MYKSKTNHVSLDRPGIIRVVMGEKFPSSKGQNNHGQIGYYDSIHIRMLK